MIWIIFNISFWEAQAKEYIIFVLTKYCLVECTDQQCPFQHLQIKEINLFVKFVYLFSIKKTDYTHAHIHIQRIILSAYRGVYPTHSDSANIIKSGA